MNTGILYLSIFDAHIKKAIPKGATESTIIDLLSKNPITANAAVVKSIYPLINFMTFGFTVLFFTTATLLCIKKPPLLFILRIVTKRSNFFCHNRCLKSKNINTFFLTFDILSLPNYRIHLRLFLLFLIFPLLYSIFLHQQL